MEDFEPFADPPLTKEEARALVAAAIKLIEEVWQLDRSIGRQLLGTDEVSYERWRRGMETAELSATTAVVIGDLGAICRGLRSCFGEKHQADAWVSVPNDAFGGRSALEVMLSGSEGVREVRDLVESELYR